jgi:hypothetical protein
MRTHGGCPLQGDGRPEVKFVLKKEVTEMDVRLDIQTLSMMPRSAAASVSREDGAEYDFEAVRFEEEKAQEEKTEAAPPPAVISREELFQFLLMLVGAARGSEGMLAQMVHDPQRMRNTLLAGKG